MKHTQLYNTIINNISNAVKDSLNEGFELGDGPGLMDTNEWIEQKLQELEDDLTMTEEEKDDMYSKILRYGHGSRNDESYSVEADSGIDDFDMMVDLIRNNSTLTDTEKEGLIKQLMDNIKNSHEEIQSSILKPDEITIEDSPFTPEDFDIEETPEVDMSQIETTVQTIITSFCDSLNTKDKTQLKSDLTDIMLNNRLNNEEKADEITGQITSYIDIGFDEAYDTVCQMIN